VLVVVVRGDGRVATFVNWNWRPYQYQRAAIWVAAGCVMWLWRSTYYQVKCGLFLRFSHFALMM